MFGMRRPAGDTCVDHEESAGSHPLEAGTSMELTCKDLLGRSVSEELGAALHTCPPSTLGS